MVDDGRGQSFVDSGTRHGGIEVSFVLKRREEKEGVPVVDEILDLGELLGRSESCERGRMAVSGGRKI